MKAKVIFQGTVQEAAIIKVALEHYAEAVKCGYVGVESFPGKPLVVGGEPRAAIRVAKQIARDIEK